MWPCKLCDSSLSSSRAGHPEVAINSLKNKRSGQQTPAAHIKKPRKGDVNFCPNIPSGETRDGLEVERVALLTESEDINVRRDCVLSCLSIYLNEDLDTLVKEYVDACCGLSAYELKGLENIREREAFLSSLKLLPAAEDLRQSVKPSRMSRGQRLHQIKCSLPGNPYILKKLGNLPSEED
ncbi:uncharacterized protein LOC134873730 isoform X3 [Eleginops maclovinus]|uniref:uncharacterized protein LOC134873730 isoform X3 n=1 Tax=Eleginops maclovinus TaxID=56733 RepID=UPI0030809A31